MKMESENASKFSNKINNQLSKITYFFCSKSTWPALKKCNRIRLGHRLSENATNEQWERKQVIIVIHGITNPESASANLETGWYLAEEILRRDEIQRISYDIVLMDWSSLSSHDSNHYDLACEGAVHASQDLAEFVVDLKQKGIIRNFHEQLLLIGVGVGAHLAGMASRRLNKAGVGVAHSIYAVDPTGPLFDSPWNNFGVAYAFGHIQKSDAVNVHVWHCTIGSMGTKKISGHVDLMVYGGYIQPGCENNYECSHNKCQSHFVRFIMYSVRLCPRQKVRTTLSSDTPGQELELIDAKLRVDWEKCTNHQFNLKLTSWPRGIYECDLDQAYSHGKSSKDALN